MQSDETVWQIINHGHCSFKAKMQRQNFCRNEHNVTGLCNRSSCPLANSRYATIREDKGKLYLCIKTVERAHTPKHLWQKIRLSPKYMKALEQVNEHLEHFPKFLVHKNKQRLTKITQYMIRMRRLALKPRTAIIKEPTRLKKMERRKEAKALKAAQIENAVERELLARLNSGTYGDIYNFPMTQYHSALDKEALPDGEDEEELDGNAQRQKQLGEEGEDEDEEDELEDDRELAYESDDGDIEYVEDLAESDDDMEDLAANWALSEDDEDRSDAGSSEDDEEESESGESEEEARQGSAGRKRRAAGAAHPGKGTKAKRPRQGRGVELEMEEEREAVPAVR